MAVSQEAKRKWKMKDQREREKNTRSKWEKKAEKINQQRLQQKQSWILDVNRVSVSRVEAYLISCILSAKFSWEAHGMV